MIGYRSTHPQGVRIASFREAVALGQAPDGGLLLPERVPPVDLAPLGAAGFAARAAAALAPFLEGELAPPLVQQVCERVFDFPVPVVPLDEGTFLVELFHGPTAAFKDFGARFLAAASALFRDPEQPLTVLVATSGDTGAAVAHAFAGLPRARVVLLYPASRVSPLQELQLTAVPEEVLSFRVDGTFDDCQAMVRFAFADRDLVARLGLVAANSINVGRLLPQMGYYLHAALELDAAPETRHPGLPGRRSASPPPESPPVLVCVPSGNLGNLTAGLLARRQGAPLGRFLAATNRNDVFARWLATSKLEPRPVVATPSNAMDVGHPSNLERIRALYDGDLQALRRDVASESVDDAETLATLRRVRERYRRFVCPHTAVALAALARYRARSGDRAPALVLGTAHPGKFPEVVRQATGEDPEVPAALARLERWRRPPRGLRPDPGALVAVLRRMT